MKEGKVLAIAAVAVLQLGSACAQTDGNRELTSPPIMEDRSPVPDVVNVTLVAEPTTLSLLPDQETVVWAYNGTYPGPTLEIEEGDRVNIHFENRLPEDTTVHWHGLHLPAPADGSPFNPVGPGESYTYSFTVPEGTAGTYLYHPHPNHRTSWQIGMGLVGAIIIRDPDDPLPEDIQDTLIILTDNRFREDGSIDFADEGTRQARLDSENGREGDVFFVNGQIAPDISIRSGETQRWRIINASGARVHRLALDGHVLRHVGSDGGLFEHSIEVDEITLGNTERVELLVTGTQEPGSHAALLKLPYDRYMPQYRPGDWDQTRPLLTLRYSDETPVEPVEIPQTLRVIPPLDISEATATREILMSQGRLNGNVMDMERIDISAPLGATEIWEVVNLVSMDHPFHLHGFSFQILSRNGIPEPYRAWKDTVNVPAREQVRLIVRYDDHPGLWMYHCHILTHEDEGMMGILEVQ